MLYLVLIWVGIVSVQEPVRSTIGTGLPHMYKKLYVTRPSFNGGIFYSVSFPSSTVTGICRFELLFIIRRYLNVHMQITCHILYAVEIVTNTFCIVL